MEDGTIWAWGANTYGGLGLGDTTDRWLPVAISGSSQTIAIAAGLFHSVALNSDGTISTWGRNLHGQLATGDTTDRWTPYRNASTSAATLSAGLSHSLYIDAGTARDAGYNLYGQLGLGSTTDQTIWSNVGGTWASLSGGDDDSFFAAADGRLYGCGYNAFGEIGDSTTTNRMTPVRIVGLPYCERIARLGGFTTVALTNPPVMISSLKLAATSITGDLSTTGTVTLTAKAGPGGLTVALSSSVPSAAQVPATVVVASGSKTAIFTITTSAVPAVTKSVISATLVVKKSATLTVDP